MVSLTPDDVGRAGRFIRQYGQEIDFARFEMHFEPDPAKGETARDSLVQCLKEYQNPDGGFGHGLESDFTLPASSSTAACIALSFLNELDLSSNASSHSGILRNLVMPAVHYLEQTFNPVGRGWFAVPREANNYPHAVWWNFDEARVMTVIDRNWGNPSAEYRG